MINWPCIFKLEGDDELIFVKSEAELNCECESLIWSDNDILIDSKGQIFLLNHVSHTTLAIVKTPNNLNLKAVIELIQAHEFSKAETCLTKIQFLSIESAMSALA